MNQRDREIEVARMLERRNAALQKLQALPNVRSVGVGLRVRRGEPTGELAFRVYVDAKVPRAKLAPADLIPEMVEGVPTDVPNRTGTEALLAQGHAATRRGLSGGPIWQPTPCEQKGCDCNRVGFASRDRTWPSSRASRRTSMFSREYWICSA